MARNPVCRRPSTDGSWLPELARNSSRESIKRVSGRRLIAPRPRLLGSAQYPTIGRGQTSNDRLETASARRIGFLEDEPAHGHIRRPRTLQDGHVPRAGEAARVPDLAQVAQVPQDKSKEAVARLPPFDFSSYLYELNKFTERIQCGELLAPLQSYLLSLSPSSLRRINHRNKLFRSRQQRRRYYWPRK